MKVGLAQIQPRAGDLIYNTQLHLHYLEQAVAQEAEAVFFPELSWTGYEPTLAAALACKLTDERLQIFEAFAQQHQVLIGLGFVEKGTHQPRISMAIFQPGEQPRAYAKQRLHEDELPYFETGDRQLIIHYRSHRIAPAICYESLQPTHLQAARQLGATIYLASVAKSASGIAKARAYFPSAAQANQLPILLVNNVGTCDNFVGAGGSCAWDRRGELIVDSAEEDALVILEL